MDRFFRENKVTHKIADQRGSKVDSAVEVDQTIAFEERFIAISEQLDSLLPNTQTTYTALSTDAKNAKTNLFPNSRSKDRLTELQQQLAEYLMVPPPVGDSVARKNFELRFFSLTNKIRELEYVSDPPSEALLRSTRLDLQTKYGPVEDFRIVTEWLENDNVSELSYISPEQLRAKIYFAYRQSLVEHSDDHDAKVFLTRALAKFEELVVSQMDGFLSAYNEIWTIMETSSKRLDRSRIRGILVSNGILFSLNTGMFAELVESLFRLEDNRVAVELFLGVYKNEPLKAVQALLQTSTPIPFKGNVSFDVSEPNFCLSIAFEHKADMYLFEKMHEPDTSTNLGYIGLSYPEPFKIDIPGLPQLLLPVILVTGKTEESITSTIKHEKNHQQILLKNSADTYVGEERERVEPYEVVFPVLEIKDRAPSTQIKHLLSRATAKLSKRSQFLDALRIENTSQDELHDLMLKWRHHFYDSYAAAIQVLRNELQAYLGSGDSLENTFELLRDRSQTASYNFLDDNALNLSAFQSDIEALFASSPRKYPLAIQQVLRAQQQADIRRIRDLYENQIRKAEISAFKLEKALIAKNSNNWKPTKMQPRTGTFSPTQNANTKKSAQKDKIRKMSSVLMRYTTIHEWTYLARYIA